MFSGSLARIDRAATTPALPSGGSATVATCASAISATPGPFRRDRLRAPRQAPHRSQAPPAQTPIRKPAKSKKNAASRLPPGWDKTRDRELISYYENQSEADAVAEDEAALAHATTSLIEVPDRLVPVVRELLSRSG